MKNVKIGWITAASLVIANMVGTGAFTSLGFQVISTPNTISIAVLWIIGGLIALSGAFAYAELGAFYKESGGEYKFLTNLYGPLIGYLAGWISLTVGFAAPIALAAMALGTYISPIVQVNDKAIALFVILLVSIIHSFDLKRSSIFQNVSTLFKVVLIGIIILLGLLITPEKTGFILSNTWKAELLSPAFAVSLIYVTYSYTGWNAAAYIVEEIDRPHVNLPKALVRGTLIVTILYLLLQMVFLKHTTTSLIAGKVEVGHIFAEQMLGRNGGMTISILISLFLLSSISAMVWVGPRVTMKMAADHKIWNFLAEKHAMIPRKAIWFQATLSLILILSGTFEMVLIYCGFILLLSSLLTVAGTFILRKRAQDLPYSNPTHPWLPLFFIMVSVWALIFLIYDKPFESSLGMINIILGVITFFISNKYQKR